MIKIYYKNRPPILQTQITDYIGLIHVEIYNMSKPKDYRVARKRFSWIYVRNYEKARSASIIPKSQKKMTDFIKWIPDLNGKYLYRFPSIKTTCYQDFAKNHITKLEWDMFHYLPHFQGSFENLFELNDLSFFDEVQDRLESEGVSFKGLFVRDIIIYEMLRINMGFKDYRGIEKLFRFAPQLSIFNLPVHSHSVPNAADMSYVIKKLPESDVFQFFQDLVEECIDYGLIIPRILLWDGQFIRANSNNNKKDGLDTYGDPDAGYCRHNGIKKGVGYDPGILYAYCKDRWFPIYFKMFPGNRSDNQAFKESIEDFFRINHHQWSLIIADSGPYSESILRHLHYRGVMPIIRARKNIKNQPVKELTKGYYFNTDYIPNSWSDEYFLKIYKFRPMIEQGNSSNNTYYNGKRLNTRGMSSAIKNRSLIYSLQLLKALTAYKCGRPDLVMKPTAFEASKQIFWPNVAPRAAMENGYQTLSKYRH